MDFMQIVTQLGVPVACMVVMAMAIWFVSRWMGTHILLPLVLAHVEFLKEVQMELKKQTESYGVQSKMLQNIGERLQSTK